VCVCKIYGTRYFYCFFVSGADGGSQGQALPSSSDPPPPLTSDASTTEDPKPTEFGAGSAALF